VQGRGTTIPDPKSSWLTPTPLVFVGAQRPPWGERGLPTLPHHMPLLAPSP